MKQLVQNKTFSKEVSVDKLPEDDFYDLDPDHAVLPQGIQSQVKFTLDQSKMAQTQQQLGSKKLKSPKSPKNKQSGRQKKNDGSLSPKATGRNQKKDKKIKEEKPEKGEKGQKQQKDGQKLPTILPTAPLEENLEYQVARTSKSIFTPLASNRQSACNTPNEEIQAIKKTEGGHPNESILNTKAQQVQVEANKIITMFKKKIHHSIKRKYERDLQYFKLLEEIKKRDDRSDDAESQLTCVQDMNAKLVPAEQEYNRLMSPRSISSFDESEIEMNDKYAWKQHLKQQELRQEMDFISKDILLANQKCQRLVQGMHNTPELFSNVVQSLEVPQDVNISYRCKIKGLSSPLHFLVAKANNQAERHIEIFFCTQTKEPCKQNHELRFFNNTEKSLHWIVDAEKVGMTSHTLRGGTNNTRPEDNVSNIKNRLAKTNTHHPDGMPLFQDSYLYITFKSITGCNIKVKCYQTESRAGKMKNELVAYKAKMDKDRMQKMQEYDDGDDAFRQEVIDTIQREQEQMLVFDEKCAAHPEKYIYGYSEKTKREQIDQMRQRRELNIQRMQDIMEKKRQLNELKLHRWDDIRSFKKDCYVFYWKQNKRKFGVQQLAYNVILRQVLKMLHYQFDKKREQHRIKMAAFFIVIRFKIYFLRRYGMHSTIEERMVLDIKNTLTFTARPTLKVAKYQLKGVLRKFLAEWSWKEKLKNTITNYMSQVKFISRRVKKNHLARRLHWEVLDKIWQKQRMRLYELLGPSNDLWEKKINKVQPPWHTFMLNTYFNRALLDSKVRFMKWYMADQEMRLDYADIDYTSRKYLTYEKLIPMFEKLIKEHEKFLDKDVVKKYKHLLTQTKKANTKGRRSKTIEKKQQAKDGDCTFMTDVKDGRTRSLDPRRAQHQSPNGGKGQANEPVQPPPGRLTRHGTFVPLSEPMPEFILIQRGRKDVIRRLLLRCADMKNKVTFKKETNAFSAKLHDIIADGGDNGIDATSWMRDITREVGSCEQHH